MASSTNPNAAQRLQMLRTLRLRGQAPVGALCVVTDRRDVELFEEIKRPVIEVWRRDAGKLDWTPVAGLWVQVVVRDWPTDLRMELFDAIRAGEPLLLSWVATVRGKFEHEIVGNMKLVNGEPREVWVTPKTAVEGASEEDFRAGIKGGWYSYGRV